MLQAVIELFTLDVDASEIAPELGSDVSYLLRGGACIVRGTGERIEPIQLETLHICLVIPPYQCSTTKVYNEFDAMDNHEDGACNDLLAPACIVEPRIAKDMKMLLALTDQEIHLSGSGSTMFGICDNVEHARELAKKIEEKTDLVAIATHTC